MQGFLWRVRPADADTFEDLTDDWFCRQMEADPMSCHFTLENPEPIISLFGPDARTLTMEEHIKEMECDQRSA